MNLIIDVGNTRVKLSVFNQKNTIIYHKAVLQTHIFQELENILQLYDIKGAIVSQVGQKISGLNDFFKNNDLKLLEISSQLKMPFKIAYETPKTIGADRLALVAGAMYLQPDTHRLIIDAGTCVTYDFIDADNVYYGGAIAPGLALRYKSLNDYTANLPLLQPMEEKVPLIGKNTKMSIQAGVLGGLTSEIEANIVKYKLKFKDLTVFLTGGDKKILDRNIKNKIFVGSKFILPQGMNYILNLNK